MAGVGWRYAVYPSADGWCTLLETSGVTTAACGDLALGPDERGSASVSHRRPPERHGVDRRWIAATRSRRGRVWVRDDEVDRVPATLMPLEEAGLVGQAFVGIVPEGGTITHLLAVAVSGEILETYELP